ncbi:4Fe-4S single cluster protein [Murinocardiopsis flavida]|uniref:4Fe-4S single cluster protein n=1 Tax=Murinocardiopsis flavida TaxID=645275 RepID=A0A2P8D950_9ACTN|nr:radical SAM/SPASM domain-containing protein [Murinocardiopsis flavida]PSK93746.1 4Fe-4S single cluster protein [Murinocardiopsis flavida]
MTAISLETTATPPLDMLWLEITTKCQLNCVHCYNNSGPEGTHGTLSLNDWAQILDDAARAGISSIQFIGGEVTLHPDLEQLVYHAVAVGIAHIEVYSNLVRVTERHWAAFSRPGVRLATSWYSDDPEEHRRITARPTYTRTLSNIAEARRRGIPVRAAIPRVYDAQRVRAARDVLVNLGVPRIGDDDVRGLGRGATGCGGRDMGQLCGGCGNGGMAVLSTGTVTPCTLARWLEVAHVGDAPLPDIYYGPAMRKAAGEIETAAGASTGFCQPRRCEPSECAPDQ